MTLNKSMQKLMLYYFIWHANLITLTCIVPNKPVIDTRVNSNLVFSIEINSKMGFSVCGILRTPQVKVVSLVCVK